MIKVSVLYPGGTGSTFNMDYRLNRHIPMVREKLGTPCDFRGMSGGPVFRVVDGLVVRLELVGFIYVFMYEADDQGNPVGDGHTLLARHADVIRPDGTLAVG